MICLTWNCQGIASRETIRYLKEVVRIQKPHILGILEPKISGCKADEVCNRLGFDDWVRVEAVGFSGGIWVLWRDSIQAKIIKTYPQFVLMQVREQDQEPWMFSIVYGSPSHGLRKHLWSTLNDKNIRLDDAWLAAGDFNAVMGPREVSDSNKFSQARCAGFSEWIYEQGLINLGFKGTMFTWRRGGQNSNLKGARLDRALCNT